MLSICASIATNAGPGSTAHIAVRMGLDAVMGRRPAPTSASWNESKKSPMPPRDR
jgi:hypothetical protein